MNPRAEGPIHTSPACKGWESLRPNNEGCKPESMIALSEIADATYESAFQASFFLVPPSQPFGFAVRLGWYEAALSAL